MDHGHSLPGVDSYSYYTPCFLPIRSIKVSPQGSGQHPRKLCMYLDQKHQTNGAFVFCFLLSFPLFPQPPRHAVFGSYLSSLFSLITLYHRCGLAFPYDQRGFVGAKKKTGVGTGHLSIIVIYSVKNYRRTIQG